MKLSLKQRNYNSTKNFVNNLKEHYKKDRKGFYRWTGIKYFLFEYNYYLCKEQKEDMSLKWENTSVEHIYPQCDTDQYWQNQFSTFSDKRKALFKALSW